MTFYRISKTDGGGFQISHEVPGPGTIKYVSTVAQVLEFFEQKCSDDFGDAEAAWEQLEPKVEYELERLESNVNNSDESVGRIAVG